MKKLLITTLFLSVIGICFSQPYTIRNQVLRQVALGDTMTTRIFPHADYKTSTNPMLRFDYNRVQFTDTIQVDYIGVQGTSATTFIGDSVIVEGEFVGNNVTCDTLKYNVLFPAVDGSNWDLSGDTISPKDSNFVDMTNSARVRNNLYLDTCSSADVGVIYKDGVPFIHNFRHPTGATARPLGNNIFVGGGGNFTMGSTAATVNDASFNIGIGTGIGGTGLSQVLSSVTTGASNIGIGSSNLGLLTTGSSNLGIGTNTLSRVTTGSDNVAIGTNALLRITTTSRNVAIGRTAGTLVATTDPACANSIYIGYQARPQGTGASNEMVIGYDMSGIGSNSLSLGNKDITIWTTQRQTTANTAGTNLLITNGGATVGATDKGTMLTVGVGVTTGNAPSSLRLQRRGRAASTGTADNVASDAFIVASSKIADDNTATTLFSVACAAGTSFGVEFSYTIKTISGAGNESHTEQGKVMFSGGNDGSVTVTVGKAYSQQHKTDAGTYTVTFTATTANPSVISVTADTDLNVSSVISYNIVNKCEQAVIQL